LIFGYARVSTQEQNLDAQLEALSRAGAERVFSEKISGKDAKRPELKALMSQLRRGDVVTVAKYDRLSRSLPDLLRIVSEVESQGADFRSLAEQIDTTTPAGRLAFHVFASIAQFERERIVERTKEGLAAARKRGRNGGRPNALSAEQRDEVRKLRDQERRSIAELARLFRVSPNTIRRA
jgi:DNA invertase Pin-like site-specific DNA recombinase